jgi:dinuclear metal center YbgI/SA1388 family protein
MQSATDLHEITNYLNQELSVASFDDSAHNGLQIESPSASISTVGFAVDAGYSVLREAVERGCQLLVVHHGVLWGKEQPVTGVWAKKLALCLSKGLSLYAAHLPLDGHPTLGNAAVLAREVLRAVALRPEFDYHGSPIGVAAELSTPLSLEAITDMLARCDGATNPPLVLPFGKKTVSRVGIATGSATFMIPHAARMGLDLFVTGEPKQESYHVAKELGLSVICMGHYASETFGVRALQRILESRYGVKTEWISEPTGI